MARYATLSFLSIILIAAYCLTNDAYQQPIKPAIDKKTYKHLYLPNGLQVLLVNDPNTQVSGAALQVHIGSFSEPKDVSGLAHFLEHMLLMGSGKYPDPDQFLTFISSKSGKANALTSFERTNYYFQVPTESFQEALDIFSGFFTDPLFNQTTVEKEVNAINSEFEKTFQSKGFRELYVLQIICNQSTPLSGFICGNYETLLTGPQQKGTNLKQKLIDFYNDYYSANLMSLVLVSNYPLESLEAWATEKFQHVKNNDIQLPYHDLEDAFSDLPKIVTYIPVNEGRLLNVSFPVPRELVTYEVKPYAYLDKQIKYKGKGSLYDILTNFGWINNIYLMRPLHDGNTDLYSISYDLTAKGINHVFDIVQWTFALISKVFKEGISYPRFLEIADEANVLFNYFPHTKEPFSLASSLANSLQEFGVRNVLTGNTLIEEFDLPAIKTFMRSLSLENCLITVATKEFQYLQESDNATVFDSSRNKFLFNNVNRYHQLYRTYYAEYPLPSSAITALKRFNPSFFIELSPENIFIPRTFDLLTPNITRIDAQVAPSKVISHNRFELWHSQFNFGSSPLTHAVFDIYCHLALLKVEDHVTFLIFHKAIKTRLMKVSSQLVDVGYKFNQDFGHEQITLYIAGLSDKFGKVCQALFSELRNFVVSEKEFKMLKEESVTFLRSLKFEQLYRTVAQRIRQFQKKYSFFREEVLEALEQLSFRDFKERISLIQDSLAVSGLIMGNIDQSTVQKIGSSLEEILHLKDAEREITRQQYADLSGNSFLVRDWSPFNDSSEQCIVSYYSSKDRTPGYQAGIEILNSQLSQFLFNVLRTTKQLGYVVGSLVDKELPRVAILVVVQGSKEDPLFFNKEIENTLREFEESLKDMSEEEFSQLKQSYQVRVLQDQKNFEERTKRWMYHIRHRTYGFDEDEQGIRYIEKLNIGELRRVFSTMLREGGKFSYETYTMKQENDTLPDKVLDPEDTYAKRQEKLIREKTDLLEQFA